jgi:drug/metabolite transporter (DMT)-like permease
MKIPYGELAALGTAFCWTASSLAFTAAAKRIGSLALNLIRMLMALGLLTLANWIRRGLPLPTDATPEAWMWLSLSAAAGFVFGDMALFRAFVLIGARLSMLVMALSPPITAVLGWVVLGEELDRLDALGMAVTLGGVAWVVLEQAPSPSEEGAPRERPMRGYLFALLGAVGQSVGLLLSKVGMKDYDPVATTQIRVIVASAAYLVLFVALGWWGHVFRGVKHASGMGFTALGALAGPFLGVTLSLVAIQRTQTGVAATIMSIVPVLIIPFVILIDKEKVSPRAALGAGVAVSGVALLWL